MTPSSVEILSKKRKRVKEIEDDAEFPRGGGSILTPLEHKQIQIQATKDVLFEDRKSNKSSACIKNGELDIKRRNKNAKSQIKQKKDTIVEADENSPKIEGLNYKRLVTGSLVLGQVSEINEHDIALSLPNNLTGYVPITSVSDKLTSRIEASSTTFQDDERDESSEDEIMLQNMFKIGQYLRAYVVSTSDDLSTIKIGKTKKRIELSLRPQDTNNSLDPQNIVVHSTLMASVASIEDHGIVLDLGLGDISIRGFMSSNEIGLELERSNIEEGAVVLCIVTGLSSNGKIIKLSANQQRIGNTKKSFLSEAPNVNSFLPGSMVETLVTAVNDRGLIGKVMGIVDVTADFIHSGAGLIENDLPSKYKIGSKLKGRLICTFPNADSPKLGITFLDHIVSYKPFNLTNSGESQDPLSILPLSSIIEKVIVKKVKPKIGLLVDVNVEGIPGFVHISRISDNKVEKLSENSGPYKMGSTHRGRITGFNSLDGIYLVSLQASTLNQPYLRIEDLTAGGFFQGKVEKMIISPSGIGGLLVNLAEGITGFVPQTHISDVKLIHPENKFKEGTLVNGRVLFTDASKRKVRLTLKKSLVNSDAKQFLSYLDIEPRMQSPGTIVNIMPNGAIVQFYGNVRAFLPVAEMSEAFIHNPREHFQIGQVVNVHVIDVDPENEKMTVSCKDPTSFTLAQQTALKKLEIGEIVSAKVLGKSETEIQVVIEESKLPALLPVGHLTDRSVSKNLSSLKKIRVGGILKDLAVIEKVEKQRLLILTNKPSLVKDAKDKVLIKSFEDVKLNTVVHGYVRNITPNSVFVQFGGGITGLISKSKLGDDIINLPDFGMKKLQSLKAKIISIDRSLRQFQLSVRDLSTDSISSDKTIAFGLINQPVINPIDENIRTINDFTIGRCTKARVTSVKETQINVQLADNVKGRIDVSQVFDSWDSIADRKRPLMSFSPKQILNVRVMGTHDARHHCFLPFTHRRGKTTVLELSAKPSDQTDSTRDTITLDKIEVKSLWIAYVNNVTDEYLWVNLTPNIRGRIAALDVTDDILILENLGSKYPVGSALKAHVINVDVKNNRLDLSARPINLEPLSLKNLSKGLVVPGKVIKSDQRHLLVQFGDGLIGQVYMTDLEDDYSEADPTKYFKNDIIRVCVCGIDSSNKKIRLSTRPSRVLNSSLKIRDPDISSVEELKVNDLVRGFIKKICDKGLFVRLSWDVTAYVRISDLSDSYIKDWKDHFHIDQLVEGKVISVKQSLNHVQISLKSSILEKDYVPPITFETLKVRQILSGKVRKVEDYGVFIVVDSSDNVSGLCHKSELADKRVQDVKALYEEGDSVKAIVLKVEHDKRRVNFGLKSSYFEEIESEGDIESIGSSSADRTFNIIDESKDEESSFENHELDEFGSILNTAKIDININSKGIKESKSLKRPPALDAGGFDWSATLMDPVDNVSDKISETSEDQKPNKRRKKSKIFVDKTGDLDTNGPCSVSDFERHLLGQPDSSQIWIQYMAFHIEHGELDKAREIAERAIQTINFKEETEKLNIWVALLNLENVYGVDESVDEIFKRACQCNDPQEIHERFISILIQTGKHNKADNVFQSLIKKFSYSPAAWYNYAHFLHTIMSSPDRARTILPRAIQSLPTHTHLNLTLKFAALEFHSSTGSPELGRTIFEGLLSTFPKRLDIWSQLLDLEVQQGDKDIIRGLFQRVLKSKVLKPKTAKTWFKKWSEWEEKNGEIKDCERVKAAAEEWVNAVANSKHQFDG